MNILLPVAGKSTRFPNVRPKWLLTNPNGNLMIVDSILGLGVENIDMLYIVHLKEHQDRFSFKEGLLRNLAKYGLDKRTVFIELAQQTKHQVDTIRQGLISINKNISFLVKDCDNSFSLGEYSTDNNFVSYCKVSNKTRDVASKSYMQLDKMGTVTNIVEKSIISDKFCCGGYYFTSANEFIEHSDMQHKDAYVSDVVFSMLLGKRSFVGVESSGYEDWGTMESWLHYKSTFASLFVDIDGTLFKNSSSYVTPFIGTTEPLMDNIKCLKEYLETNRIELILTTSRPEEYRSLTEEQLSSVGLTYSNLIMGLQHAKRIIINDFSQTNPYKSCEAINIKRDEETLRHYIKL